MKTYREMADRVRARGEAIRAENERKHRRTVGTLIPSCLCLVLVAALIGGAVMHRPDTPPPPVDGTTDDLLVTWEGATTSPPSGETNSPETTPPIGGTVDYLSATDLTDTQVDGVPFQYTAGSGSYGPSAAPPAFQFQGHIHVVVQAVEEYAGIRETLVEYGGHFTHTYRLFRMKVLDPLNSGLSGEFLYLLPEHLKGDLTAYDALLIAMTQLPRGYVLRCDDRLTAYEYLFVDDQNHPELGNIIAFTDEVFDESLWQDRSWIYGYQFAQSDLDEGGKYLLVSRGSTLQEALKRRKEQGDLGGTVTHPNPTTAEEKAMMDYIQPFKNGVFAPYASPWTDVIYHRYINGCPTSERIVFHADGTVTTSGGRFEAADLEGLPNLARYIEGLDLSAFRPQHTDPTGKDGGACSAIGWYEKTADGHVYAIVRLAWTYYFSGYDEEACLYLNYEWYDETFILLDETGDHVVSREELTELIGENRNIYSGQYGTPIEMPLG